MKYSVEVSGLLQIMLILNNCLGLGETWTNGLITRAFVRAERHMALVWDVHTQPQLCWLLPLPTTGRMSSAEFQPLYHPPQTLRPIKTHVGLRKLPFFTCFCSCATFLVRTLSKTVASWLSLGALSLTLHGHWI